jgi:hypothetical protein
MRRHWLTLGLAVLLLVTLPILYIQAQQLKSVRDILNDVWDQANRQLMGQAWIGGAASGQSMQTEQTIFNDVWDAPNHMLRVSGTGGAGGSGGPFNLTTTGVNTGQVLTVGTGSSIVTAADGIVTATKWDIAPNPCGTNLFVTGQSANKTFTCTQPTFSNLSGVATDAQIPDLNTLSTTLTPGRCVEVDGNGKLSNAAAACGTGSGTPGDAAADSSTKGVATFLAADFNATAGLISLDYTNAQAASAANKGFLTASDWLTFTNKLSSSRTINTTAPLQGGGDLTSDRTFSIADAQANGSSKGVAAFSANDFNATSGVISLDYVNAQTANSTTKGFLSPTDWTTFNNKPVDFNGLGGVARNDQIPPLNGLATGLTPLRCVETDGAGRLTSTLAACGAGGTTPGDAAADGVTKGVATFAANDFNATAGVVAIDYANGQTASASTKGYLSAGDWATFNAKPTTFAGLSGVAADAQIPDLNVLSTGLLASRCVETDATTGKLTVSASACSTQQDLSPYAKLNGPQILTQTQITPRAVIQTVTANAFTVNLDITDVAEVPALAAGVTVNAPAVTGSNPRPYHELSIVFAPTPTPRTITWNVIFSEAAGIPLPTSTTGDGSTWNLVKVLYNPTLAQYVVVANTAGVTRGITTLASSSTYTCNPLLAESCEMQNTESPGTGITMGITTGSYTNGTKLLMRVRCTGTQALTLPSATFLGSTDIPITGISCSSNAFWKMLGLIYSQVDTKWQLYAVN